MVARKMGIFVILNWYLGKELTSKLILLDLIALRKWWTLQTIFSHKNQHCFSFVNCWHHCTNNLTLQKKLSVDVVFSEHYQIVLFDYNIQWIEKKMKTIKWWVKGSENHVVMISWCSNIAPFMHTLCCGFISQSLWPSVNCSERTEFHVCACVGWIHLSYPREI